MDRVRTCFQKNQLINSNRSQRKKGLTQEKLALLTDVSNNTLVKIEMGMAKEPTITTMAKIADALNVSIDELVGRKCK